MLGTAKNVDLQFSMGANTYEPLTFEGRLVVIRLYMFL